MPDEKDRLGDKLRDAERGREDQFFAQRDRELIEKLRGEKDAAVEEAHRTAALNRCPKCGTALRQREHRGVKVDECSSCGGIWLDHGEFEELAGRESEGWFGRFFRERLG